MCWGLLKLTRDRISARMTSANRQGSTPVLPLCLCPLLGSGLLPRCLLLGDPPRPHPCCTALPSTGVAWSEVVHLQRCWSECSSLKAQAFPPLCADWELRHRDVMGNAVLLCELFG